MQALLFILGLHRLGLVHRLLVCIPIPPSFPHYLHKPVANLAADLAH